MKLQIDEVLKRGIQAHQRGLRVQAARHYSQILDAQPQHADANHNMGILEFEQGNFDKGIQFIKMALSINSGVTQYNLSYVDALIKLGRLKETRIFLEQSECKKIQGKAFEQVQERLDQLERAGYENLPQGKLIQLLSLYKQGLFEKVVLTTNELIARSPKAGILYNLRGAANAALGHYNFAIDSYKKALQINPNDSDAYNNMGSAFKEKGDIEAAMANFEKAVKIKPDFVKAHNNIGELLYQKYELEASIESFIKALKIKPDYLRALYNMGNAFKENGDLDKAIITFKQAIKIKPEFAAAYNNLGNVLQESGQTDEALASYKQAIKIKPNFAEAYNNIGKVLTDQTKLDDASEFLQSAIAIKPEYAEAYNNIGTILHKRGDFKKAVINFKKAIVINPKFSEAYYNVANSFLAQGMLTTAIKNYKFAVKFRPDYPSAYNNMGHALLNKGNIKAAVQSFKKAITLNPNYANAYWNLSGTSKDIDEAKGWLKKCVAVSDKHLWAEFTLAALNFYEGNKRDFEDLADSSWRNHPHIRSFSWVFSLPELPKLYFNRWDFYDFVLNSVVSSRPFYEYGVWRGDAFRYFIKTLKKGYGFDTFTGLPEDWYTEKSGTYSSDGNVPKINGGKFTVGKFEDTLPEFFSLERPMASLINFDADLYSSTFCALTYSKPIIDTHTILIFDELLINENWEKDEYKALEDFCKKNNFTYTVIAVSFFTKQVAVRLNPVLECEV